MTTTLERTMLDRLMGGDTLGLPATIRLNGSGDLVALGLDNGNGHTKIALHMYDGSLQLVTVPTVYKTAREIRGGAGITTYQVNGSAAFWIGSDALQYEGDALPIGSTAERISDQRQRDFLAAVLVEALMQAGYEPGIHNLAVGFAIPNDEIVLRERDNKLGVSAETREALKHVLNGKTFTIKRIDQNGMTSIWTLTYTVIAPQAQSLGTYLMWRTAPDGTSIDNGIEALTVIDIGTGDLQRTDIDVNPYRLMGEKLGRGTIVMARQLAQRLPQHKLNDAQATNALIYRSIRYNGRRKDISDEVDSIIAAEGHDLVTRMLPTLQQTTRFVLFTGGGVLLDGLRHAIEERAAITGKHTSVDYEIVPDAYALGLNAIGALVSITQRGM